MINLIEISVLIVIAYSVIKSILIKQSPDIESRYSSFFGASDKKMNPYLAALSIFASLNGGFMVLGLVQVGYEGGLSGYFLGLAYIVGIPLLIFLMSKLKSTSTDKGIFGIDKLIQEKYGNKTVVAYYLVTGAVFVGVLGGQMLSVGQFLKKFDDIIMIVTVLVFGVVGTAIYTIRSGFEGVIKNDIIQSILEFTVALIFPISIFYYLNQNATLNFSPLTESVGGTYGITYPIFGALFLILTFSSRADLWQRINLVEKTKQKRTLLISAVLLTFFYFMMTSTGIVIKQNITSLPIPPDTKPGELVTSLIQPVIANPFLQIICMAGILIAIFSSLDSYLNLSSLSITKFALWRQIPKIDKSSLTENDKETLIINARITTIIIGVIAAAAALVVPDIVELMAASFSVLGVLVPIVLVGWFSKKKQSDWTGAIPLYVTILCLVVCLPLLHKIAFLPAFFIGLLTWVVMLLIQKFRKIRTK